MFEGEANETGRYLEWSCGGRMGNTRKTSTGGALIIPPYCRRGFPKAAGIFFVFRANYHGKYPPHMTRDDFAVQQMNLDARCA